MSLKMKDLVKTDFDGKTCVGFAFSAKDEDISCNFLFKAIDKEKWSWSVFCVIPNRFTFSENANRVIEFAVNLPKNNLSLTTIANIGLEVFKEQLKQEVQNYMQIDCILAKLKED